MMAKRIEDRYASMENVADSLRDFLKQQLAGHLVGSPQPVGLDGRETQETTASPSDKSSSSISESASAKAEVIGEETELRLLLLDINNALRDHQTDGLLEKVERFREYQPDNPAMLRLFERIRAEQRFKFQTAMRAAFQKIAASKAGILGAWQAGTLRQRGRLVGAFALLLCVLFGGFAVLLSVLQDVVTITQRDPTPALPDKTVIDMSSTFADSNGPDIEAPPRSSPLTLNGHTSAVQSVTFSADGKRLASASDDGTVNVWDATSGRAKKTLTLKGHTGPITGVAFSADGKRLASASIDQTVKVWDTTSGQETLTLKGHTGYVMKAAFSADGKWLASASSDQTVTVWDATSGLKTLTLKGHAGWIMSVVFSSDGKRLASASSDQTVKVWDATTGQETLTLNGHTSAVQCVAFSPDGKRLASAARYGDQQVKVWDATSGQETLSLKGHTGGVTSVAFSTDGQWLASGGDDRTVKVWDVTSGQETLTLKGHINAVTSVVFSPNSKRLASASMDQTVRVWDVALSNVADASTMSPTSSPLRLPLLPSLSHASEAAPNLPSSTSNKSLTLKGHTGYVMSVVFSRDGKRLASASWDQLVKVWDANSGQEMLTLKGHTDHVLSVTFSADGKRLASASREQTVKVWDATSGQAMLTLKGHTGAVTSVAFSPDGNRLASASFDQMVKVWDAMSGQVTRSLRGHTGHVMSVLFSPDGKRLASASRDGTVKVWDATSGQETLTLNGHTAAVTSVVFSPDGRHLASASYDQTVKVWDAMSGQETLTLKGHTNAVSSVAFSAVGNRLASASYDQTVKVWDSTSGQETLTLKGHVGTVVSVAFSADGKRLASAGLDQTVRVWDVTPGNVADAIRIPPDPEPTSTTVLPLIKSARLPARTMSSLSNEGVLLCFDKAVNDFRVLPLRAEVKPNDRLICPEPFRSDFLVSDGVCQIGMVGGTAVTCLESTDKASFGFEVSQGALIFESKGAAASANAKEASDSSNNSGIAITWLGESHHLELVSGDARCGIAVVRQHPTRFESYQPGYGHCATAIKNVPTVAVMFHVARGTVRLDSKTIEAPNEIHLTADAPIDDPPINAKLRGLLRLDPMRSSVMPKEISNINFEKSFDPAQPLLFSMTAALKSPRPSTSLLTVKCLGLTDNDSMLVKALLQTEHREARLAAFTALRLWLPMDVVNRNHLLTELRRLRPEGTALVFEELITGFTEEDSRNPGIARDLVTWLDDDEVAIREMAFWHLQFLTGGLKFDYSLSDSSKARKAGVQRWRNQVQRNGGTLPTR